MDIIIAGGSARAAAWSALRAGLVPLTADLFADRDLCRVAKARAVPPRDYPHGLIDALADISPTPWMYTGALENHPALVERMSERHPLWGNGPSVLRRVRSPFRLAEALGRAGLPCPAVSRTGDNSRRWLIKPFAGAAGRGIDFWDGACPVKRGHYLQEFIEGDSWSAAYLGDAAGKSQLIGVTRQLLGAPGNRFAYRGSVGPLPLSEPQREVFERLGDALVRDFGLRGLFGVDCVMRDGVPWTVEVNPRYTASMELFEWAWRIPLLLHHAAAFSSSTIQGWHALRYSEGRGGPEDEPRPSEYLRACHPLPEPSIWFFGKAIVYAERSGVFPDEGPWEKTLAEAWCPWEMPEFADIPRRDALCAAGRPVMTVFARGDLLEECVQKLSDSIAEIRLAATR